MTIQLKTDEIKKIIKEIENIDLKTAKIEDLENKIKSLIIGYKACAPIYKPPLYLYRARLKKFNKLEEIYCPKPERIKKLGRINEFGQPFFYSSTARSVPFFELNVKKGDQITIACWKTTKDLIVNPIGFSEECSNKLNSKRKLSEIYEFTKKTEQFNDTNKLIQNYLASKFIEVVKFGEEYRYKITIAIAKKLMMGNLINGILYPTIAMNGNAENIALKPEYANKNLQFVSAEHVKIENRNGMEIKINVLDSATQLNETGEFMWSGRNLQYKLKDGEAAIMKSEGSGWNAYNTSGQRIDPV